MPVLTASSPTPRLIIYFQTHHFPSGTPRSLLPLVSQPNISVTHVIIAAIHLHDPPENIKLNDHEPSNPRNRTLWIEVKALQQCGIKVLGMLGGAAKGTFSRLDLDEAKFEMYYKPLKDFIEDKNLDGLDLDVEEEMSLSGILRLIDRLKSDFGKDFLITMAPVATALISDDPEYNLSGFSYEELELMRGRQIAWYNTQFYCGWGDMSNTDAYDEIIARGYPVDKIVVGLVTNPENGRGWIPDDTLQEVLAKLKTEHPNFGGVMGWEYFNALPGGHRRPWEWAVNMTNYVRDGRSTNPASFCSLPHPSEQPIRPEIDLYDETDAPTPNAFEYLSENEEI